MRLLLSKRRLYFFVFLLAMILVLNLSSQNLRETFSFLLSPFQAALWEAGISKGKIQELEKENLLLSQKLLLFEETEKENSRLREALSIPGRQDLNLLFAEIVGKEVERDVLIVNKGRVDGVRVGMPVITQSMVAAGSIGEVFEHTSKVLLFSLDNRSLDVKIQGKELIGVLKGKGRYQAALDLILKEQELSQGDVVVTSSLGGIFPNNLLVGEVKSVEKSDLAAFQGGEVALYFHVSKENSLFVVKNSP